MRVIETAVYRGAHLFSRTPMVRVMVDLGALDALPTNRLPGFAEALLMRIPRLTTHGCSRGRPGGFVKRLEQGTWLGHVVEHVALALQTHCGHPVTRGKTRSAPERPGVYNVLYAYRDPDVALAAGAVALQLVASLLPEEHRMLHLGRLAGRAEPQSGEEIPGLAALRALADRRTLGPTTQSLADAARRRDIPVYQAPGSTLLRLGWGSRQTLLSASLTGATSHLAVELAGDKQRTRRALEAAGIPVPAGVVVGSTEEACVAAQRFGTPVVTKPLDGNHGRGVSVGLIGDDAVSAGCAAAAAHNPRVIVEQQVLGRGYRALVVGGRLVAVAERVPARVIGDGVHSGEQLVARVNDDPRRGEGHRSVLTRIRLDHSSDRLLAAQSLTRAAVPRAGAEVWLRETANLSTGGEAIDRTDDVHPDNAAIFVRAAAAIGLDIAGLDIITTNITRPLREVGGGIIEVNAAPGFRMHVSPSTGPPRDVGGAVIDMLYPRGSAARIPVVAVTGTNGKSTTVRMIGHILGATGRTVGMTTTTGVYVDEVLVKRSDASGPRSARMLLDDPTVDVAVLETARGGILREGLAVDRLDVGVLLNVSADHLGLGGVDTLTPLARVKSVVVRAVSRRGMSVLNADDALVMRFAAVARGRHGYVTLRPPGETLRAALAGGALVATCEPDGMLVLLDGENRMPLLHRAEIPATLGGGVEFTVFNALAAAAAVFALRVPPALIAERLRTFEGTYAQNPGRMNLTRAPGFTTILDYAHNPAALTALGTALESFRPTHDRFIGVVSTPGDRRDEDIREVGRIAADIFAIVIFRERPDGRGRAPGEVVRLLREGTLGTGASADRVHIEIEERAAMEFALRLAAASDLVALMPTNVEDVWRQVEEFGRRHAAEASETKEGADA